MLANAGPSSVTCDYGGSYALQSCHELLKIDTASHTVWAATFKEKLLLVTLETDKTEEETCTYWENYTLKIMNKIKASDSLQKGT